MVDLYDYKLKYKYKAKDKVIWNKKIFKACPFEIDEIKEIGEVNKRPPDFIGILGIRQWWAWWEVVPMNIFRKPIYWIKFYLWYYLRFKKL